MTPTLRTRWSRKEFAIVLTIVTFVCVVAVLSLSLAHPKPLAAVALGTEWQCKTSFFLTSCTRTPHAETVVHNPLKNPICLRRA